MKKIFNFLLGLAIGGVVGGALAILFAPSSGKQLRRQIADYTIKVSEEVKQAAQQRRTELEQELSRLRQPIVLE